MKRITKALTKARELFRSRVIAFVLSKGARHDGEFYYLQTSIGELRIHPFADSWIACRFDDNFAASVWCECNPHSGKWNFHYSDDVATLSAASTTADFENAINRLLAYVPSPENVAKADQLRKASKELWAARNAALAGQSILPPPRK